MKTLDEIIASFDNWTQPGSIYDFVLNSELLTESDKELFKEIWGKAGAFELWNHFDLILGCKICANFIRDNYNLSEEANANIVSACAYQWK